MALSLPGIVAAQDPSEAPSAQKSSCHAFIDYKFIWTLEVVTGEEGKPVPILNIITFTDGEWDFRPKQVHLFANPRMEAEIEQFSIDTGVPGEPYRLRYLKVLGNSFIGVDLIGDFEGYTLLEEVTIELGDSIFQLEAIDCLEFESLAKQINQINYNSPDVREDFAVLDIGFKGKRVARRQIY